MLYSPAADAYPNIAPVSPEVERPFWTVIIPVYNRTNYLSHCLATILNQDPGPEQMEIIVQDDCSEKAIAPIVREHGRGRVLHVRNETNLGLYGNTNAGLDRSTGHWIHVLHDDDWVQTGFYSTLKSEIDRAPADVGVCCCRYTNYHEPDGKTWSPEPFRASPGKLENWIFQIAIGNPLNIPAVVIKRHVHEQLGGYATALTYCADWEFYIRASTKYAWWYHPADLACYRVHPSNLTKDLWKSGAAAGDLRKAIEMAERYLPVDVLRKSIPIARQKHAQRAMQQAFQAAKAGMNTGAWTLLQESLKLCGTASLVDDAFRLLNTQEMDEIRHHLGPLLAHAHVTGLSAPREPTRTE